MDSSRCFSTNCERRSATRSSSLHQLQLKRLDFASPNCAPRSHDAAWRPPLPWSHRHQMMPSTLMNSPRMVAMAVSGCRTLHAHSGVQVLRDHHMRQQRARPSSATLHGPSPFAIAQASAPSGRNWPLICGTLGEEVLRGDGGLAHLELPKAVHHLHGQFALASAARPASARRKAASIAVMNCGSTSMLEARMPRTPVRSTSALSRPRSTACMPSAKPSPWAISCLRASRRDLRCVVVRCSSLTSLSRVSRWRRCSAMVSEQALSFSSSSLRVASCSSICARRPSYSRAGPSPAPEPRTGGRGPGLRDADGHC